MTTNVQNQAVSVNPVQDQKTLLDESNSIVIRVAKKFGVMGAALQRTLANTCFKIKVSDTEFRAPTAEELMSLMLIAEKLNLNPFIGEIYAFPSKNGGITPIVGINGWRTIAANQPGYSGVRFEFSQDLITVDTIEAPRMVSCFVRVRRPDGSEFESQGIAFFKEKYQSSRS